MKQTIQKLYSLVVDNFHELLLYGFIGGGAVAIDLGLFFILVSAYKTDATWYLYFANILAIAVAVVYSFTLNSVFTFKTRDNLLRRFMSFAAVSCFGISFSSVLLYLGIIVGIDPNLAKIISLPFIFIVQFVLNNLITFRKKERANYKGHHPFEEAIEEGDVI